ncbi:hypothetical protein EEQ68_01860 [Escherichia coli]|nr:hypothetical protein [Escherichia coli]EFO2426774.1 hypothetical protein [Escherichia coli]
MNIYSNQKFLVWNKNNHLGLKMVVVTVEFMHVGNLSAPTQKFPHNYPAEFPDFTRTQIMIFSGYTYRKKWYMM